MVGPKRPWSEVVHTVPDPPDISEEWGPLQQEWEPGNLVYHATKESIMTEWAHKAETEISELKAKVAELETKLADPHRARAVLTPFIQSILGGAPALGTGLTAFIHAVEVRLKIPFEGFGSGLHFASGPQAHLLHEVYDNNDQPDTENFFFRWYGGGEVELHLSRHDQGFYFDILEIQMQENSPAMIVNHSGEFPEAEERVTEAMYEAFREVVELFNLHVAPHLAPQTDFPFDQDKKLIFPANFVVGLPGVFPWHPPY